MGCPKGQHQHKGADGKRMLRCHSISEKHTNPTAQNFHLMAMQGGGGFNQPSSSPSKTESSNDKKKPKKNPFEKPVDAQTSSTESNGTDSGSDFKGDEDYDENYGKEDPKIKETKRKAKIKSNNEIIRAFIKTMTTKGTRMRPLLMPLCAFLSAYDMMSPKITAMAQKAKTAEQKKLVAEYDKTIEEIVDTMPKKDVDEWVESDIDEMTGKFAERMGKLAEIIKKKGKNCPEYAQYRAYHDYLAMCEERQQAFANRLGDKPNGRLTNKDVASWFRENMQQARQRNGAIQPIGGSSPPSGMYQ